MLYYVFLQVAASQNKVFLNASALMLNIGDKEFNDSSENIMAGDNKKR